MANAASAALTCTWITGKTDIILPRRYRVQTFFFQTGQRSRNWSSCHRNTSLTFWWNGSLDKRWTVIIMRPLILLVQHNNVEGNWRWRSAILRLPAHTDGHAFHSPCVVFLALIDPITLSKTASAVPYGKSIEMEIQLVLMDTLAIINLRVAGGGGGGAPDKLPLTWRMYIMLMWGAELLSCLVRRGVAYISPV